jgi:hypothetical protein
MSLSIGTPAREREAWAIDVRRRDKRAGGFLRIGANDIELRDHAQSTDGFDRLMRRTIFANADRVVREDVDVRQLRERGEPDRRPAVIREDHKRRAGRAEDAVIADTIQNGAHPVLTDAEADVPAVVLSRVKSPAPSM